MFKKAVSILIFILSSVIGFSQNIDSLKLRDSEIPNGYKKVDKLLCKTPHAFSLYDQVDLFPFLGKVVKKDYQSFEKKGDKGTILYFEFEKPFEGQAFLDGLLYGEGGKPTKRESDEYVVLGNILIVWSFAIESEIKARSKEKVATF